MLKMFARILCPAYLEVVAARGPGRSQNSCAPPPGATATTATAPAPTVAGPLPSPSPLLTRGLGLADVGLYADLERPPGAGQDHGGLGGGRRVVLEVGWARGRVGEAAVEEMWITLLWQPRKALATLPNTPAQSPPVPRHPPASSAHTHTHTHTRTTTRTCRPLPLLSS